MTCSLQMMKRSETMQEWTSIFPDFTTLTGSSQFIKKLMAISVSTITYLRGIFPATAYGERRFCGIKLKILTEDSGIESVNKFINLIRSCYDAVDKKYLSQLNIGISMDSENRDNVIESYNMNFRFRDDESLIENKLSPEKLTEKNSTVQATYWLLKSILSVTDHLEPLPPKAFLTMKLLYNDDITPIDYEPPGFEPSDVLKFSFPETAVKLELGKVSTDVHSYKMSLKTALNKKPLSQMLEESILTDSQKSKPDVSTTDNEAIQQTAEDIIQDSQNNLENTESEIDCPCTCKQEKGTNILTCSSCGRKQHAICYGILQLDVMNNEFHCIQCMNEFPFRNSQEDLIYKCEGKKQQDLCAFRRALVICEQLKQVTTFNLEKQLKCSKQLAKDLTERLVLEGFLKKTGVKSKYTVNEKKITDGYQEYFSKGENKENIVKSRLSRKKALDMMDDNDVYENSGCRRNYEHQSEDQIMDNTIAVENLNIKGPFETAPRRNPRRSLQAMGGNDIDQHHEPKKKRCMNTKEMIAMN